MKHIAGKIFCSKCKTEKGSFIKYAKNKQKTQYYYCRFCNTERAKKYRNTKIGAKNIREAVARSIKKHQWKQDARVKLNYQLKVGNIKKENCLCGSKETQAHHDDYLKPLEIRWLCRPCHADEHRQPIPVGV